MKLKLFYILILIGFGLLAQNPDSKRFQQEIDNFIDYDLKNSYPDNYILFIGSSSIRLWKTAICFDEYNVVNRGFGGACITDMLYFYEVIAKKKYPKAIIFYCGDNDISINISVNEVYRNFIILFAKIKTDFPNTKILCIPTKPSKSRLKYLPKMLEYANLIKEYCKENKDFYYVDIINDMIDKEKQPIDSLFCNDKLHLSEKGYNIWTKKVKEILKK